MPECTNDVAEIDFSEDFEPLSNSGGHSPFAAPILLHSKTLDVKQLYVDVKIFILNQAAKRDHALLMHWAA